MKIGWKLHFVYISHSVTKENLFQLQYKNQAKLKDG